YMMGADKGVLLTDRRFAGSDVLATAYTLSQGIKMQPFDIVICGKQTTDGDTAQVGAEIAEFMGIPHVTNVRKIVEVKERSIIVEADLPDVVQVMEIEFPCLITVEKDINQPRLPSFKRRLQTASWPVEKITLMNFEDKDDQHYGLKGSPTKVQRVFPPTSNVSKEVIKGEPVVLATKLHQKLKELKFT
nr:electron transfer flavoprotein subunit beta/FixA family protein [Candidatus Sigynarchaeota archaeon]